MPRTLIVSDIHEPVTHPGAFDFIDSVCQSAQPDRIIFIGDIVDHHGISFWVKHPAAPGPKDEYELSLAGVQRWYEAYPDADVMIGNHDERPIRVAEKAGIPGSYLKDYATTWQTPGWRWRDEVIYEDVLYTHGTGRSGMNPAANLAKEISMSCAIGHVHSTGGVKWFANPTKRWFGMDVGCLVDDRLYAFAYGKRCKKKSVLGCGVVDSDDAMGTQFIVMPSGRGERFDRRNYPIHPLMKGRLA
jgi:predicted phosphodiesterase